MASKDSPIRIWAAQNVEDLGLKAFEVYETSTGAWKLQMLAVDRKHRGEGRGSRAMECLCSEADLQGRAILLSPASQDAKHGTTSRARLVRFYKRFGFVENKGRKADFSISEGMYRLPQAARKNPATPKRPDFFFTREVLSQVDAEDIADAFGLPPLDDDDEEMLFDDDPPPVKEPTVGARPRNKKRA